MYISTVFIFNTIRHLKNINYTNHFTALVVQPESTATLTKIKSHHFGGLLLKELHPKMKPSLHSRCVNLYVYLPLFTLLLEFPNLSLDLSLTVNGTALKCPG